ncbi:alpha/beta hydrolase [Saccharomonospora sp. NPDC006951]
MKLGLPHLLDSRSAAMAEETRAFHEQRGMRRGPADWNELRSLRERTQAPVPANPPATVEQARHGDRTVPVRIHLPASTSPSGVLMDIHGGGFYLGSAAASDVGNRALAEKLGVAVVSVDYRLAPENPWPAAPDDCETAALWLAEHAAERFGTRRLAITGASAGATLAMTTLVRLRDRGAAETFEAAALQFGTYDISGKTPSGRLIAEEYFIEAYAGAAPDRTHPDISPIYADLTGLPPTLMIVGEDDVLLGDNFAMAARLSSSGVDVDLRVYPASPHGFTHHPTPVAEAALDDLNAWLGSRLTWTAPIHRGQGAAG